MPDKIDVPQREITGELAKLAGSARDAYLLWKQQEAKAKQWEVYYKDLAKLLENGLQDPCEATVGGVPILRYVEFPKTVLNTAYLKEKYPAAYLESRQTKQERRLTMVAPQEKGPADGAGHPTQG